MKPIFLVTLAILGVACQGTQKGETKDAMPSDPVAVEMQSLGNEFPEGLAPLDCGSGVHLWYGATGIENFGDVTLEKLGYGKSKFVKLVNAGDRLTELRFDICFDEGSDVASLGRILYKKGATVFVYTYRQPFEHNMFKDLIFGENVSNIELRVPFTTTTSTQVFHRYIVVKTPDVPGVGKFLTYYWSSNPDTFQPDDFTNIAIGVLRPGDVLGSQRCTSGEYVVSAVEFQNVHLEFGACKSWAVDGTDYLVKELYVKDSSDGVPEEFVGGKTVSGAEMKSILKTTRVHHNDCDRFEIKVGFASYKGISMNRTGICAEPLGLPLRVYSQYGTNPETETTLNCAHFMSCGPATVLVEERE
ncbi:MAG: hypothetical protein AB7T49_21450 [Oligoflexales bacterium]